MFGKCVRKSCHEISTQVFILFFSLEVMGSGVACGVWTYSLRKRALHSRGPALHTAIECLEQGVLSSVPEYV